VSCQNFEPGELLIDDLVRNSVTGACLPPSIVWLARAVKVVFWRTAEKEKALLGRPPESPP
jgi:hypothetical protein